MRDYPRVNPSSSSSEGWRIIVARKLLHEVLHSLDWEGKEYLKEEILSFLKREEEEIDWLS
ncbi:hypothetical protein DRJ17_04735 [Candidatus Woesearchaeota archaeon]|nr:MAG: hypothetical protein DRJ17_04735 [Candidatus Woesearchaeota archaeon]